MTSSQPRSETWGGTLRIRAEVLLTGSRTLTGYVHLQPIAPIHLGPETPDDVLNRSARFFPLTDDEDRTIFISKWQVLAVGFATYPPFDDPDRVHAARSIELRVELSDGSEFSGMAMLELPPNRTRALDFLNEEHEFFALHGPEAIRFVNRHHIRLVTPLD